MRLLAMIFGVKIRHHEINKGKFYTQYWFNGKWY